MRRLTIFPEELWTVEPLVFENIIDEYQNLLINVFHQILEPKEHRPFFFF